MTFEFATAGRILFGEGVLDQAGAQAAELGSRVLVVGGGTPARIEPLSARLADKRLPVSTLCVVGEPSVASVLVGAEQARDFGADLVIGMGGGSAIDAAKAIAALLTNPGDPFEYLEVVGRGRSLVNPAAPLIAIPTTAGTGAEVTRNTVLAASEQRIKVSLRHRSLLPAVALVDPVLTYGMPPAVTAGTGLDALTQCLEPFVSHLATPLTDGFCREGMRRAARSLRCAFHDGSDVAARRDMALTSLCGGLALANARLGAVHGLAGPIGGMFDAPHGAVCARLLPPIMAANVRALRERDPASPALARHREVAAILTGDPTAEATDGVAWMQALGDELAVPGLADYGVSPGDLPAIVAKAMPSSSMQGNPIALTAAELTAVLTHAL
ncbi:MAG: iron-containing alcohol dehydrogenase [Candidatus Thiosymbion ectosymbiont of Robbea hypermnestra]|nr:iron-containing alcohol dehydrogenase [Candidatus Thiosymbion ectosymbiont of Robbea hypermnestra]